jgi:hypothetical protein
MPQDDRKGKNFSFFVIPAKAGMRAMKLKIFEFTQYLFLVRVAYTV